MLYSDNHVINACRVPIEGCVCVCVCVQANVYCVCPRVCVYEDGEETSLRKVC